MGIIFELLFQFFAEILLQAAFELLAELGYRGLANRLQRPRNPIYSIIGFIILGAIAGSVSLLILPYSPIEDPTFRKINLVAMPIILGLMMMLVAKLRQKKSQDLVRIDRFGYAFVFAFAMGLVRFIWAE